MLWRIARRTLILCGLTVIGLLIISAMVLGITAIASAPWPVGVAALIIIVLLFSTAIELASD